MPISTPPLDYKLDREGTSGISTGPDLTILDWSENYVDPGTVGRVCVRGEPVFPGYVKPDGTLDKSAFNPDGWFDTGDLGYMDADGYLYITGRSKEVINRGGELISPFEVENAILSASMSPDTPISGRVSQVLAFSTGHDVLQEVVAVALVTPDDKPRVDLKTLHNTLRSSLHQAKWPALVTYMNDLPKKNNKILRTKLSERLNLPKINDDMQPLERHWEGDCPPVDTALSEPIPSRPCSINGLEISKTLDRALPDELDHHLHGDSTVFISPSKPGICKGDKELVNHVKDTMAGCIHNYMIPTQFHLMPEPFPRTHSGSIDEAKLLQEHKELQGKSAAQLDDTTEGRVTKAFAEILQCGPDEISPNIDFFTLGGDSLRAGRLVSLLRNEFKVSIPISIVFNYGTVKAIASHLEEISGPGGSMDIPDNTAGCAETRSSTNPFLMLLQLIPIVVIYPIRRALQWTAFLTFFTFTGTWSTSDNVIGRLFNLTVSIMFGQILVRCFTPFVGILAKWIIIGRHREGLYPMWGLYHTRWWLVQKIVSVCGKGIFKFNNTTEVLYLRLMGAKVGKGVKIDNVQMGEWDLLDIRDGAALAGCMCRPFAAEGNTSMYLGRIVIGEKAFVGSSSIVAAGTEVPADTCIGPNSSSWEVSDAEEENRELTPSAAAKPHWVLTLLITIPLSMVAWFCSLIPWLAGLLGMMITKPVAPNTPLTSIVTWFSDPERVGYHYFALILRTIFAPFIFFMFTVVVRSALDLLFGRLPRGSDKPLGTVDVWRAGLIKSLLPVGRLHKMTDMFGQHYEATSIAVRMLGGNIGKRVYWPGTGPSIGDYHLLDIGDDVVFGSRSHIVTSDGFGSAPVRIGDGAMIADRVTLLPGVDIGDGAIMGSGAMTRRGKSYGPHGTYVGSKGGDSVCLSAGSKEQEKGLSSGTSSETASESNYSPFGRAFYMKQAPYRVLGPFAIFCYSAFTTVFTAFYWNVPNISSVQIVNVVMTRCVPNGIGMWWDVLAVFLMMCVLIAILTTLEAILALAIVIASKWALLGRRKPGNYDWDKSPYCQRWQMFLCIEKLRRNCYSGQGILNLLTGTHWLVLYFKALGADIGKDCALFANGKPSLMFTEPDLIKLGDRVVVDDASVVAHINTRGKFDLNPLEIGDRCVLRCGSRLLSGARMKDDSCLLEHTLIMGGDIVEDRWTMQGWPAERFTGPRIKNA